MCGETLLKTLKRRDEVIGDRIGIENMEWEIERLDGKEGNWVE